MSRNYVLTTVLCQMPANYLGQFFQRLDLLTHFDFREYSRTHVPALLKALEDCPPDSRAAVHFHLRDIVSLSNPDGAEIIFDQVAQKEPARLAEVADIEHVYARAMWLNLEFGGVREGLFEACLSLNEAQLQRYSASRRVQNLPSLVPVSSPEVLRELEIAIAAIYR